MLQPMPDEREEITVSDRRRVIVEAAGGVPNPARNAL